MERSPRRTRWRGTMTERSDPWDGLKPPQTVEKLIGTRVSGDTRWPLFWALDAERRRLLILQHNPGIEPRVRLPLFRGLEVERRVPVGEPALLTVRLIREEFGDLFQQFCADTIRATAEAPTEKDAVNRFVARAWLWQRFLAGGKDGRLSDEEQKGLLGELAVLRDVVAPALGMGAAVASWTGPLGAPKDFEIGRSCVESKAFSGGTAASVRITSEHQLDTRALDELFLVVSEVAPSVADAAVTLAEYVASVRSLVDSRAPDAREAFESRLIAAGFDSADDYSDSRWQIGTKRCFRVGHDFPRITPDLFPSGVHRVRYRIALAECEPFRVPERALATAIGGGHANQS